MPSTVIRSFAYDADTAQLRITFQTGRRYVYTQVPPELVVEMTAARVKGEFFNAHIRGQFSFVREADAA